MSGFVGRGRAEVVTDDELVSFDDYRRTVLDTIGPLDHMQVRVGDALGLVLADDVIASEPLPGFANSAMDGYAVQARDLAGATVDEPVTLQVTGEAAAGHPATGTVEPGSAIAIMTGGQVPVGADAVVPVERTSGSGSEVAFHDAPDVGANIRTVGQDVAVGTHVLSAGARLTTADIGLLAALGVADVMAVPTPRVAVISTGDELVPPGHTPGPGQLRDSNGPMVRALVRQAGALAQKLPIVGDDHGRLREALDSATGHADLIITTGGVSAGRHDHLVDVVRQLGEAMPHKVAMKPGMPQLLGVVGDTPLLGLPGNPVSTFVSFELFARPAIRRMQGRADLDRPIVRASLTEDVGTPQNKRTFVRVRLEQEDGRWKATPSGGQGSHVLSALSAADGLAIVDAGTATAWAGETVPVLVLVEP